MSEPKPLTVSQVNARVRALVEQQAMFQHMVISGELGGVTHHQSGHLYFTLKDAQSELSGVMYRTQVARSRYQNFRTGDRVLAYGSLTVYEPRGRYQLLATRMEPDGIGELYQQLQRLKEQLAAEGLFEPSRKRPLPPYPRHIALITSPTGAVLHDIQTTLARRGARLRLTLIPATVQGEAALPSLLASLSLAQTLPGVEAVLVARGGGSLEDLWCFNEAAWVRAVAACKVPVVSAIGHETDITLTDLAADLRAPTPTAAAELISPSLDMLLGELAYHQESQRQALRYTLDSAWDALTQADRQQQQAIRHQLTIAQSRLHQYHTQLDHQLEKTFREARHQVALLAEHLAQHDPARLWALGYTRTELNGKPVTKTTQVNLGDRITTYLQDGKIQADTVRILADEAKK